MKTGWLKAYKVFVWIGVVVLVLSLLLSLLALPIAASPEGIYEMLESDVYEDAFYNAVYRQMYTSDMTPEEQALFLAAMDQMNVVIYQMVNPLHKGVQQIAFTLWTVMGVHLVLLIGIGVTIGKMRKPAYFLVMIHSIATPILTMGSNLLVYTATNRMVREFAVIFGEFLTTMGAPSAEIAAAASRGALTSGNVVSLVFSGIITIALFGLNALYFYKRRSLFH